MSKVPEGYAVLLAHGFDSWQETVAMTLSRAFVARLEKAQDAARAEQADAGDTVGEPFQIGDEVMHMRPFGAKGGVRWVLAGPDFLLMIRSPKMEWCVTVRYLAAGLWQYGVEELRHRVTMAFWAEAKHVYDHMRLRVSRADFAFDFYSPAFSGEFTPALAENVVTHSSSKVRQKMLAGTYSRGGMGETLTIGSKAGLEVEVYDKTKEIREASGKDWMFDIWAAGRDGEAPLDDKWADVWRLEVRMGKEFLRERDCWHYSDIVKHLSELIAEALYTRRLALPKGGDTNRARWPLHPLWTLAYEARGAGHMRPLGKQITMRRSQLDKQLGKQLAGTLIAAGVLAHGKADREEIERMAARAVGYALSDDGRAEKAARARERYRFLDEAV
ncbi:MAG: hypothetical protein KIS98_11975 [Parvibaculum sp.]|nr:replication initiation factor domain-containing protein [Parvibaculum sp.]MCW5728143.1 hypothetical protein [Parvibaculum sp.]